MKSTAKLIICAVLALVMADSAFAKVPKGTASTVTYGQYTAYYNSDGECIGSSWGTEGA